MPREMPLFGQDMFEQAQATKGWTIPAYRKARDAGTPPAPKGIDKLLERQQCRRAGRADHAAAWQIDAVNGDNIPAAARAASPRSPAIRTSRCRWAR